MSVTVTPQSGPITSAKLVVDADCNATSEDNVTGASTVGIINDGQPSLP